MTLTEMRRVAEAMQANGKANILGTGAEFKRMYDAAFAPTTALQMLNLLDEMAGALERSVNELKAVECMSDDNFNSAYAEELEALAKYNAWKKGE